MEAEEGAERAATGGRPWKEVAAWGSPEVPAEDRASVRNNWILSGAWAVLALPVLWLVPRAVESEPVLGWLVLLFPASAVGALAHAAVLTLRWRRHGPVVFEMDPHPGSLGGEVAGVIERPGRFHLEDRYRAVLNCVTERLRERKKGIQKDRLRSPIETHVVWQEEGYATIGPGDPGKTRLTVRFRVPGHLPESDRDFDEDRRRHRWELYVEGEGRTQGFERRFDLPVFDTGGEISEEWADVPLTSERGPGGEEAVPEEQVVIRKESDGTAFHFPRGRRRALGLLRLMAGPLVAAFPPAVIALTPLPRPPLVLTVAGGGFLLALGSALLASGVWHLTNALHVFVSRRGFRVVRSVFGFTVSERELAVREVDEPMTRAEGRGSGRERRRRWKLVLRVKGAGWVVVGDGLVGERVADRVRERMLEAAGMEA